MNVDFFQTGIVCEVRMGRIIEDIRDNTESGVQEGYLRKTSEQKIQFFKFPLFELRA